jgi:purine/pyrimidine-nucleoside phosphorylase
MSQISQPGAPKEFAGVKVVTKANVYFDGGVVSHTLIFPDGSKKTLGLIRPGSYHFNTDAAERMEIVAGGCRIRLDNEKTTQDYGAGAAFDVPGRSGFHIEVTSGVCEYICSFLQ